jgi:hypothetical protein
MSTDEAYAGRQIVCSQCKSKVIVPKPAPQPAAQSGGQQASLWYRLIFDWSPWAPMLCLILIGSVVEKVRSEDKSQSAGLAFVMAVGFLGVIRELQRRLG